MVAELAALPIVGGIAGGIFGAIGAREKIKEQKRFMKAISGGLDASEMVSAHLAEQAVRSPEFRAGRDYYMGLMGDPLRSPLVSLYGQALANQQVGGGMYLSPAARRDFAGRMAGRAAQLQMQAAPQLINLAGAQERFRQEWFPQIAEMYTRNVTGGMMGWQTNWGLGAGQQTTSPMAAGFAGALGGIQAGMSMIPFAGGMGGMGGGQMMVPSPYGGGLSGIGYQPRPGYYGGGLFTTGM